MLKVIYILLISIGPIVPALAESRKFHSWNDACDTVASAVEEGDLIFLDIPNVLFRHVAEATNTWTSHVGIVFKDQKNNWIVAESSVPISREVPLCQYLKRSSPYSFEVKRLKQKLEPSEVAVLRATASGLLNKFYTLNFNFDSDRLFCSKFVYLTYKSIGIDVGHFQTFRELLANNPDITLTFWRLWFLGFIPWEQRTITPASQLNDPQYISVMRGL